MPKKKELDIKDQIKLAVETYNKIAHLYKEKKEDKIMQFQLAKFVSMLPKKGKVMDAGSGCGRDSAYLKEDNLEVISIDLSDGMINEAKKLGVETKKEDLLKIKNKEEFDGIWCMATLADVPKKDASKLIKNFYNSLKEKGVIYLAVKEGDGENIIEKKEYNNHPRFYALYKEEELRNLLEENKFSIIEIIHGNDEGTKWLEVFAIKK
ncbi:class I SAM-dependent methyltransferase [Candidatus Woesearchaeota archaeon]|nr:class I SAM-dependent methyltransferase [Candidatus Woesearchaeota archaeon]